MSRHRAVRHRAYSYDDYDGDDYYDEEDYDEGYEEDQQQAKPEQQTSESQSPQQIPAAPPGVQPQQQPLPRQPSATSLSSYFDHAATVTSAATAGQSAKKKTPKRNIDTQSKPPTAPTVLEPESPVVMRASSSFDDELVGPVLASVRMTGIVPDSVGDHELRVAIRTSNYDADAAVDAIMSRLDPDRGSSLARALCATDEEDLGLPPAVSAIPPRIGETAAVRSSSRSSSPFKFDTPSPDDLGRAARQGRVRSPAVEEVFAKVGGLKVGRGSPSMRERLGGDMASPPPAPPDDSSSVANLQKDPEVWEEDVVDSPPEQGDGDGKTRLSMVVIGHVDAGKSTLMGQVLVGTGLVSERELRRYEKEAKEMGKASFYLAWLMDEDSEERAHGVTMEVGQKAIETAKRRVTLLDAPGHADFIPQMITGAAQADVALLVVPAVTGEFEAGFESSGQTKEHALLARSLGVTQLLVAVNKMDAAEPPWTQARFDQIVSQLAPFLEITGYRPDRTRFVPVSGLSGENVVKQSKDSPLYEWYSGPSLLEAIDDFAPTKQQIENRQKPLRALVTDVQPSGRGVVAQVRVMRGALKSGSKALVMPFAEVATVRSIEIEGRPADSVVAGEHADVTLQGVAVGHVLVGSILCKGKDKVPVASRFVAQITTLPSLQTPILKGAHFQLHMQTLEIPANTTRLIAMLDKKTADVKQERPRCLPGDARASVEIRCQRPVCIERFEDSRALGRFVLRHRGVTVAVGMVTDVLAD